MVMMTPAASLNFTSAVLDSRVTFARTTSATNPATYVNSSGVIASATNNEPRFEYDPVTLSCKGLLIEESRANLTPRSSEFDNPAWGKTRISVSQNVITSPDGTQNADKLVEDSSASTSHFISQTITLTAAPYTASIFAKKGERSWMFLKLAASGGNGAYFDLNNGAVGTVTAGYTATITNYGNGWYRCAITVTATAAGWAYEVQTASSNNGRLYTGDGTSGIYVYGSQLEAGAFSTSYIPTTTAALTRNADVATITGTNFSDWWNAGTGGTTVKALPSTVSGTRPLIQFDDGTANEIIALRGNTTNPELYIVDGGTPQAQIDAGTIAANTAYRLAAGWATNDCSAVINGGAVVVDGSAAIPTVTQARLGSDGTNYLNGHLQTIEYYNRKPTNTTLEQLSSSAGRYSVLLPILKQVVQP